MMVKNRRSVNNCFFFSTLSAFFSPNIRPRLSVFAGGKSRKENVPQVTKRWRYAFADKQSEKRLLLNGMLR